MTPLVNKNIVAATTKVLAHPVHLAGLSQIGGFRRTPHSIGAFWYWLDEMRIIIDSP